MSSDSLIPKFEQQQFPAAIPQLFPEKKPRKKRVFRSVIKHERSDHAATIRQKNAKVFEQVLQCYIEVSSLSPLGAFSVDPLAKRNGLTYVHVEWLIDVEHCAKSVLSAYLHQKWQSLLSIESQDLSEEQKRTALSAAGITPKVMGRLAYKLGQAFHCRELKPGRYFTTIRRRNRFEKVREQEIRSTEAADAPVETNEDAVSAAQVQQSADFDASDFETGYGFGIVEPQDSQQEE